MLDASYHSLIERMPDGRFTASVTDLPGVTITGDTEEEVICTLSQTIRQCVREMIINGEPVPKARLLTSCHAKVESAGSIATCS